MPPSHHATQDHLTPSQVSVAHGISNIKHIKNNYPSERVFQNKKQYLLAMLHELESNQHLASRFTVKLPWSTKTITSIIYIMKQTSSLMPFLFSRTERADFAYKRLTNILIRYNIITIFQNGSLTLAMEGFRHPTSEDKIGIMKLSACIIYTTCLCTQILYKKRKESKCTIILPNNVFK